MSTAIVWLRSTLRVHDNLLDWAHVSEEIDSVIPVFVWTLAGAWATEAISAPIE